MSYDPASPPLKSYWAALPDFASGASTPRRFLESCIERFETTENSLKAFVCSDWEAARAAADAATRRYEQDDVLSLIDGFPVGVKDIIETADFPTGMNSPIYEGWRSFRDAACVKALRDCGAVLPGKTVTTEFACGESGPTTNPHDPEYTPGGSSSGTAASVGGGVMPAGLATQTRASTIRPASYCGAYGFKPTHGALHTGGIHPVSDSLDHLGVIGASVEDNWIIARHIAEVAGGVPGRPSLAGPLTPPEAVRPEKIGVVYTSGWDQVDDASADAFAQVEAKLADSGVRMLSRNGHGPLARFEDAIREADPLSVDIMAIELEWPMAAYLDAGGELGPTIRNYLDKAAGFTGQGYADRLEKRDAMVTEMERLKPEIDVLISLSASGPPPKGLGYTGSRSMIAPWTLFGTPAWSLPVMVSGGMPLGLQVIGFRGDDARVTAISRWMSELLLGAG
jgi:Asp-tRNA(Asn)/Glu-tRNA(Gln) amidotransferase A subunit family amidase